MHAPGFVFNTLRNKYFEFLLVGFCKHFIKQFKY